MAVHPRGNHDGLLGRKPEVFRANKGQLVGDDHRACNQDNADSELRDHEYLAHADAGGFEGQVAAECAEGRKAGEEKGRVTAGDDPHQQDDAAQCEQEKRDAQSIQGQRFISELN